MEEGLDIVRAVRDRYDGRRRNPWNEFECGSNYARSMASYSLLLALSGFSFDLRSGHLGFRPVVPAARFRCFWSIDGAWGGYRRERTVERLSVLAGSVALSSFASELVTPGGDPVGHRGRRERGLQRRAGHAAVQRRGAGGAGTRPGHPPSSEGLTGRCGRGLLEGERQRHRLRIPLTADARGSASSW